MGVQGHKEDDARNTSHTPRQNSEGFSGPRECVHSAPCAFRLVDVMGAAAVPITGLSGIQQPSAVF